ncbi:DUF262 domain-containing protein [Janibacter sp. DB-40]|uniref:DUF262 domain-containing protein n=1 Tax=Janibacter sp. DB-40 TaxID=3028808 RepID=UPI002404F006|nr:DUF262 domain-containing protein [Janibacter sp. DB-40]
MAFQTPKTVEELLTAIHKNEYLMPAIQREFVWGQEQIIKLMDSLMRGYPIGSFLLWDVEPTTAQDYTFYEFLTHYHERDKPYANKAVVPVGSGTTAILDGQQRLTSLNIALYGSHAVKKKYAWWNSTAAFPTKRLYLNLADDPIDEELGVRYDLKFLDDAEARPTKGKPAKWFKVGDVLTLDDAGPKMLKEVMNRGLENTEAAYQRLYDLHQAVRVHKPMNYYLVKDQDANKVLEIFVRVNSGGTPLSYSDLLLSMATNQWEELDAREEVRDLVQELNTGGTRQFSFSKDVVLKSALMIAGVDLRFRVSNFTQENMAKVEKAWPDIENALTRAANLLRQFGFTDQTLTADSVIVPIAYYFHRRGLGDAYLDSGKDAADRQEVQKWVTRSLIKRGVWGSGLDTALTRIRSAMDSSTEPMFPVEAIEVEMSGAGKSLAFEETEIDELLSLKYGGRRTFAVLSILYPGLDFGKSFHQDHVFPKSRFTPKRLTASGVPADQVDDFREAFNLLPNLQLLVGAANVEKQSAEPSAWLQSHFASDAQRQTYLAENDLIGLPLELTDFMDFFTERKARMRARLTEALGAGAGGARSKVED